MRDEEGAHRADRGPLRLADCSVFVDFDGTISLRDIGPYLLDRFVPGRWEAVDGRYERAEIGSQEYVRELWRLLSGARLTDLQRVAGEVGLDPGFASLVTFLRSNGAEVTVVSDGLGFYVPSRCSPFRVPVLANGISDGVPHFPNADPTCPCGLCGTYKARPVRAAKRSGRTTVVIGDGTSDRFGAVEADLVFAKDSLTQWCGRSGVAYVPFGDVADVERTLRQMSGLR